MSTIRTDVGTVEDLHASATKACGLDDFGVDDDNYREALRRTARVVQEGR